MRLDLFLKVSRLLPRRSLAQEFCDKGLVRVNGSEAKSSKQVMAADEVEIRYRDRATLYRIEIVPASKQVSKADAANLTTLLRETAIDVSF